MDKMYQPSLLILSQMHLMNPPSFQYWVFTLTAVAVVTAALYDYKRRLIPNFITFPALFMGLLMHAMHAGWSGFYFSLLGLAVGGGVFLIFYLIGGIGAGDVKLLGGVGALLGGEQVLAVLILTALFGGIMAIGKLACNTNILNRFGYFIGTPRKNQLGVYKKSVKPLKDTIPYGVAIAIGTLMTLAIY